MGLDIAKRWFQVHAVQTDGSDVLKSPDEGCMGVCYKIFLYFLTRIVLDRRYSLQT